MNKKTAKSFSDVLNSNNLSAQDIARILSKMLNSKLTYLLEFNKIADYINIQQSLEFDKKPDLKDFTVIEYYIALIMLKSIEKGNMEIFNILTQESDTTDKDLYQLMDQAWKIS